MHLGCQVTFHPTWKYPDTQELNHQSYQVVSDDRSHNSVAVHALVKTLLPFVKRRLPQIEGVNYLTHSPSSQYRTILYLVDNHSKLFEQSATWQFIECVHGKGVGGSAKRTDNQTSHPPCVCQ